MVVCTDAPSTLLRRATTSPVAAKRQKGNMRDLLLMNVLEPAYRAAMTRTSRLERAALHR
jgi:hypothetical protein